jgi:hypothetical protein
MSAVREALMLSWLACGLLMSAAWASFLGYQIFRLISLRCSSGVAGVAFSAMTHRP